jgi:hypothetical protein
MRKTEERAVKYHLTQILASTDIDAIHQRAYLALKVMDPTLPYNTYDEWKAALDQAIQEERTRNTW